MILKCSSAPIICSETISIAFNCEWLLHHAANDSGLGNPRLCSSCLFSFLIFYAVTCSLLSSLPHRSLPLVASNLNAVFRHTSLLAERPYMHSTSLHCCELSFVDGSTISDASAEMVL